MWTVNEEEKWNAEYYVEKYKVRNHPQLFIDSIIAVNALICFKPCTYLNILC